MVSFDCPDKRLKDAVLSEAFSKPPGYSKQCYESCLTVSRLLMTSGLMLYSASNSFARTHKLVLCPYNSNVVQVGSANPTPAIMPFTDVAANSFISRNLVHRNYKMFNPIETPMYFHILVPHTWVYRNRKLYHNILPNERTDSADCLPILLCIFGMMFVLRTARLDKADVHVCTSVAQVCPFQHVSMV
jgi:hypothetical protein